MMLLLLSLACADIAFTLGGDTPARAAAADTSGDTATDTGGDTSVDTGADTSTDVVLETIYTLGDVVAVPTAPFVDWMSPGDVNGDGLTDLVTSTFSASSWSYGNLSHDFDLVLSDGSGGYTVTPVVVGLLGDIPLPTLVADFDGDGLGDLAAVHTAGLSVFRFDGTTLTDRVDFSIGTLRVIKSGDLDSDGDIDLVGLKSDEAVVWTNDGAGGFVESGRVPTLNGSADVADQNKLHLYDFDTDGNLDLFCSGDRWYTVPVQVNLGVGDGTFGPDITSFPDAPYMLDVFVDDYDGDGMNEVAFLDANWQQIAIGEWTGTVSAPVTYTSTIYASSWVTTGDVDGDGDGDIIGTEGFEAAVLEQTSTGMGWRPAFPIAAVEINAMVGNQVYVTGNADNDGCDDLFVFDYPEGYRVAPSHAAACSGGGGADTDGEDTEGEDTEALDTADTAASSFTGDDDARRRPACSTTDGRSLGSFGLLLAALAARRRRG